MNLPARDRTLWKRILAGGGLVLAALGCAERVAGWVSGDAPGSFAQALRNLATMVHGVPFLGDPSVQAAITIVGVFAFGVAAVLWIVDRLWLTRRPVSAVTIQGGPSEPRADAPRLEMSLDPRRHCTETICRIGVNSTYAGTIKVSVELVSISPVSKRRQLRPAFDQVLGRPTEDCLLYTSPATLRDRKEVTFDVVEAILLTESGNLKDRGKFYICFQGSDMHGPPLPKGTYRIHLK